MSIASEIQRLQGVRTDIFDAITNKGVTVPSGAMLADCPSLISSISGGGGLSSDAIGGRIYSTITIGDIQWMAENLDFKFSGLVIGQSDISSAEPRGNYYSNDERYYGIIGNRYGLLYNWIAVKYLEDNKSQLIPGWHVPTSSEYESLFMAVGGYSLAGTKLKSVAGWSSGSGDGSTGFSCFPTGFYNGRFIDIDIYSSLWTITEIDSSSAYRGEFYTNANVSLSPGLKDRQYSVRLVKDSA